MRRVFQVLFPVSCVCVCVYLKFVVSYPGNLIVDLSLIRLAQTSFTLSMYSHTARIL
jgi:hypothetical protein